MRHADAGYERALEVADERGVRIPMRQATDRGNARAPPEALHVGLAFALVAGLVGPLDPPRRAPSAATTDRSARTCWREAARPVRAHGDPVSSPMVAPPSGLADGLGSGLSVARADDAAGCWLARAADRRRSSCSCRRLHPARPGLRGRHGRGATRPAPLHRDLRAAFADPAVRWRALASWSAIAVIVALMVMKPF